MPDNKKSPQTKSETSILHSFQLEICRNSTNPCPYWDNGCAFQNACRKYSRYKQRVQKEERVAEANRIALEKTKMLNGSVSKETLRETLKPIEELLFKLEVTKSFKNSIFIFDIIEAKNTIKKLIN